MKDRLLPIFGRVYQLHLSEANRGPGVPQYQENYQWIKAFTAWHAAGRAMEIVDAKTEKTGAQWMCMDIRRVK